MLLWISNYPSFDHLLVTNLQAATVPLMYTLTAQKNFICSDAG